MSNHNPTTRQRRRVDASNAPPELVMWALTYNKLVDTLWASPICLERDLARAQAMGTWGRLPVMEAIERHRTKR